MLDRGLGRDAHQQGSVFRYLPSWYHSLFKLISCDARSWDLHGQSIVTLVDWVLRMRHNLGTL